ncbi:hypothetical protein F4805DRAFT_444845 [Annulohypoxylon moriforme]|nr:hypothetical protein F4805DRAFT_444845 [Annulohypoxylon moriforme]
MPNSTSSGSSSTSSRFVWPFTLKSAGKLDQYRLPNFVSGARRSSSRSTSTNTSLESGYMSGSTRLSGNRSL